MDEQPPQVPVTVNLKPEECMTTISVLRAFASQQNAQTMRAIADVLERFETAFAGWQQQNSPVQIIADEPPEPSDNHKTEPELAAVD